MANDIFKESKVLVYPENLSEQRYIAFDFYRAETQKEILDGLKDLLKSGVEAITDIESASTTFSSATDKLGTAAKNIVQVVGSKIKQGDYSSAQISRTENTYTGSIYLPLPNNVAESAAQSWNTNKGAIASLLNKVGGNTLNEYSGKFGALTGSRAVMTNPDLVQMYNGPEMRSLSIQWTFLPKSAEEAKRISDIIKTLKAASSPELDKPKTFMLAPLFCSVSFTNKHLDDITRFDEMQIVNITTNYGSDRMELFWDGMPKQISVSIDLGERRAKFSGDWTAEYENRANLNGKTAVFGGQ